MRRMGLVVAVCALVGAAEGRIELFWSTTGLSNTSLLYSTALTNFLPIVSATPVSNLPAGAWDMYLWGRFVEEPDLPTYTQIYGIDLRIETSGGVSYTDNVAYRQYKTGFGAYKRWDGTLGRPLDGVLAAVTARGIEFILPPDVNSDLYFPESHEFLLGAIHTTSAGLGALTVSLDVDDGLGIAVRIIGGETIPDPLVTPAIVTFLPEPSTALLALAGLALRRR